MTEGNETPTKKRNMQCEVRMIGEDGQVASTQVCDNQPSARAWIRDNGEAGRFEIVRVLEEGVAVKQSTCTLQPLPVEDEE